MSVDSNVKTTENWKLITGAVLVSIVMVLVYLYDEHRKSKLISSVAPESSTSMSDERPWYVVHNDTGKCTLDDGPSRSIQFLQETKRDYRVYDIKKSGDLIDRAQVVSFSDGVKIMYYHGLDECLSSFQEKQSEVDRYR